MLSTISLNRFLKYINTMVGNSNLENGITQIYYSAYVFEIFTPPNGMHVISYQNTKTYEYI
jgi:hypothetical protein